MNDTVLLGLYEACKKGDLHQVKELLKLVRNGLNSSLYEGRSLLMWSVVCVCVCVCVCACVRACLRACVCPLFSLELSSVFCVLQFVLVWVGVTIHFTGLSYFSFLDKFLWLL